MHFTPINSVYFQAEGFRDRTGIFDEPKADTRKLEKQLDEMVSKLYELTEEEIKTVEGRK